MLKLIKSSWARYLSDCHNEDIEGVIVLAANMGKYEIEYVVPTPSDIPWCKYDYEDKAYKLACDLQRNGYNVNVRCEEIT